MVRATYFNNKENDTQHHRSPHVKKSKDNQSPRLGGTAKENPSRMGQ